VKRVLLLKPGVTSSRAVLGDYEAWFSSRVGARARFYPVELHAGEAPPPRAGFDAVVMSGSPLSVTTPTEWMVRAGDFLVDAADAGAPVLGVCFGHQLLAWRLGGAVQRSPKGRELGTIAVALTDAGRVDPLFHGLPDVIRVQSTHEDEVAPLPDGATLLATTEHCRVQAFAWGRYARGVQFHPEMDQASTRWLVNDPKTALADDERQRIHAQAHDAPFGAQLLINFLERF